MLFCADFVDLPLHQGCLSVPLKPHTVPFNAVWRPSRDIVVPLAWPSQLTLHS